MGIYWNHTPSVSLSSCPCIWSCLHNFSWTARPFFIKLGMVVYNHKVMCHVEKLVHYIQCQCHSKSFYNQNMTISTISAKLLVRLQLNLKLDWTFTLKLFSCCVFVTDGVHTWQTSTAVDTRWCSHHVHDVWTGLQCFPTSTSLPSLWKGGEQRKCQIMWKLILLWQNFNKYHSLCFCTAVSDHHPTTILSL